jgi:SSS family solute:Na+ symporter
LYFSKNLFLSLADLLIVFAYFILIFVVAVRGRQTGEVTSEEYFLSSRNLKWYSIAFSTIATNIQGYQFLGMMGSAYLFGLAQASLEINAIQGILMAAFIFVPMYLRERVVTITQFINKRLGNRVGLVYSVANLLLFSTITLGAALFWGAYAAELVFAEYFTFISEDRITRIVVLLIGLGVFSAIYTYLGGLAAVVKTDIVQFIILFIGATIVLFVAIKELGGWEQLYVKTPQLMHLHLPADHPKLPWIHVFGLFLLNINYWCANQTVVQRSLAAKNLGEAQKGLLVGGVMKYFMAVLIVIPGIALFGIVGENGISEPDMAFPYLVNTYLPTGVKGIVLCALFASLMSTVDSTFNSLATMFSIDIYKMYIKPEATDYEVVSVGRRTILFTLVTGITMGLILLYVKFENPEAAFTHTLNELRYYINCGIVVLICSAIFMVAPSKKLALVGFFSTIPLHLILIALFPDMNYFVRAFFVIVTGLGIVSFSTFATGWQTWRKLYVSGSSRLTYYAVALLFSLVALHVIFH